MLQSLCHQRKSRDHSHGDNDHEHGKVPEQDYVMDIDIVASSHASRPPARKTIELHAAGVPQSYGRHRSHWRAVSPAHVQRVIQLGLVPVLLVA